MQSSILFVCMCFSTLSFCLSVLYYFLVLWFLSVFVHCTFFVCYHILWWIKITITAVCVASNVRTRCKKTVRTKNHQETTAEVTLLNWNSQKLQLWWQYIWNQKCCVHRKWVCNSNIADCSLICQLYGSVAKFAKQNVHCALPSRVYGMARYSIHAVTIHVSTYVSC